MTTGRAAKVAVDDSIDDAASALKTIAELDHEPPSLTGALFVPWGDVEDVAETVSLRPGFARGPR